GMLCFFFSSRRRHTRFSRDWSSDVCSTDLNAPPRPHILGYREPILYPTQHGQSGQAVYRDDSEGTAGRTSSARRTPAASRSRAQIGRASCRERGGGAAGGRGATRSEWTGIE